MAGALESGKRLLEFEEEAAATGCSGQMVDLGDAAEFQFIDNESCEALKDLDLC
jgi:hypothetical protein